MMRYNGRAQREKNIMLAQPTKGVGTRVGRGVGGTLVGGLVGGFAGPPLPAMAALTMAYPGTTSMRIASTNISRLEPSPLQLGM